MFDTDNDLVYVGQPWDADDWLVSSWEAGGLSSATLWSNNSVRISSDGAAELLLAPIGSGEALGGEMRSGAVADVGTFSWTVQVPEMVSGAVFGMFVYQAAPRTEPALEYDFEFVGANTRSVQLTVHMQDSNGNPVRNLFQTVVDLGFDAAKDAHVYDVVVTGTGTAFRVDGEPIAYFSAEDMPGGIWYTSDLRSCINLWAGDDRVLNWAGDYTSTDTIMARILDTDVRDGDLSGRMPLLGDDGANTLEAVSGHNIMVGFGGNDTLIGGTGDDQMKGGSGADSLSLSGGSDLIDGGTGTDWLVISGSAGATVNLAAGIKQATGLGTPVIRNVENVEGGSGVDTLYGNTAANVLEGGAGADALRGQAGADVLVGGLGRDLLAGGGDDVCDVFVFEAVADSALGASLRDTVNGFVHGIDEVDLRGIDANGGLAGDQVFAWGGTTAKAFGLWGVMSASCVVLKGDVNGDGTADFEILINGVSFLDRSDLLL